MKVAIYARYSSENQSEKSIDDQIRVCKKYIEENRLTLDEKHIFADEALSGSLLNRPGLQALERAMQNKEIDAVAVDDLSRLSRSNHQMLTMVSQFNYYQVKIISVSEGIISDDDNSKLGIHIRGLINEIYLDDLKKKTLRSLEGQKLRGFSTGESVYGYKSHPVGELRLNKKGQPKYEGMVHKIYEEEAIIVRRIYKEFVSGKSIKSITRQLNEDQIPTRRNRPGGWNTSTVSRILKSEKYTGKWVWRQTKNVRDPITGKRKQIERSEKEKITVNKEELLIIDQDTWEKAEKRWQDLNGSWPMAKITDRTSLEQKSYIYSNPKHLLAGLLKCKCCGGAIVQISGKGGGYYGCYNAQRKTCKNKLLIPRKRVETILINDLKSKILTPENIEYIYKNIEKYIAQTLNTVPEGLKQKKAQSEKIQAELQNLLNFIKAGNFSKMVSDAITDAENRQEKLSSEMKALDFQKNNAFKAPLKEWIDNKLEKLHEILDPNTKASALALKELLGTIDLEPVQSDPIVENGRIIEQKPHYRASSNIETLALLDNEHKGSNWLKWRTRLQPIRTLFDSNFDSVYPFESNESNESN